MNAHRNAYPEQYDHPLVGRIVRTQDGRIEAAVLRVVPSRFGELAVLEGQDATSAWAIASLTVIR